MTDASGFWDRLADRYAAHPIADEDAYRRKLEVTRGYLTPETELLEFGAGTGTTALLHAPLVRHIRAVDFSARMVEIARAKARAQGVANVDFEQGAIETLEAPDACYDVVMGMSVLHLVADRAAVLGRVHRLLKPGGVFVSSTACLGDSPLRFLSCILPLGRAVGLLPHHLSVFTPDTLRAELAGAGFVIEHDWRPGPGAALFLVARKPG